MALHLDGLIAIGGEDTLGRRSGSTRNETYPFSACQKPSTMISGPST